MYKMGVVFYMILFIVCVTGFHGHLVAPTGCPMSLEWPENCANRTYCFEKPKDYPRTDRLKEMLKQSHFSISNEEPPKRRRRFLDYSEDKACREFHMRDTIYMIKDDEDSIRYVVQAPKFEQIADVKECKTQVHLSPLFECQQTFKPMQFVVTSCDGKGVERVSVRRGIPNSCALVLEPDYD